MFITLGKTLMALMWLTILIGIFMFSAPFNWLLPIVGALLLLLHALQLFAIRDSLQQSGALQKGDSLQLLLFGVFAMWQIHKRTSSKSA
ncbi:MULTISPECIES: DUF1145 domain-containing protein [unclassified Agarivorans]|uniref:DUF1145 domain-containing protein n=1 Tax=unclassified Agarivorans TaxID=2636026 RepID=UPI003D7D592D